MSVSEAYGPIRPALDGRAFSPSAQHQGMSSSMRLLGQPLTRRVSRSVKWRCGSTPFSLQLSTSEGDDQPVQPVPRRPGFVAEVKPAVLRRQPGDEPPHALRRGVELAEVADLPLPSLVGDRRRVAQLRRVDPNECLS